MSDKSCFPDLSASLKSGLSRAVQSYEEFKEQDIPYDAKGFAAYHNACKSALMHIALLLKMSQSNRGSDAPAAETWVEAARSALLDDMEENDDMFSA